MKPLVTLRCPRRCKLGVVVVIDGTPQLALQSRELVQKTLYVAERQDVQRGPFGLDELDLVDVGCRHAVGEPLAGHAGRIVAAVEQVRRGAPRHDVIISLSLAGG